MISFNNRLRELRETRDISQQTLADRIGISKSSINMYERGEREPGLETLESIADFFNVDMDYLLGKSEYQNKTAWLMANGNRPASPTPAISSDGISPHPFSVAYEKAPKREQSIVRQLLEPYASFPPPETLSCISPWLPACAGNGNYLDENVEYDNVTVLKNRYTDGADLIIKLQGDSMEPEFHDGDQLLVTTVKDGTHPINGRVGIFIVDGEAFLRQPMNGRLHPYNPAYKDITPNEYTDVRYVGYVIGTLDEGWIISSEYGGRMATINIK